VLRETRWGGKEDGDCFLVLPFNLPPPPGVGIVPEWTGRGFRLGDRVQRVLAYESAGAGWSDELTALHESMAGDHHYIDVASREHAASSLVAWQSAERPVLIDIGCSSGFMLELLRARFPTATVLGADCVREPLERLAARLPDVPLLQFNLLSCPLPDRCVDGVVLLNVLEHISDDYRALRQVRRILRPNGVAVIELPAGPGLYDVYDKVLLHVRRYSMRELTALLTRAGFQILERSHLGFLLYPAFALVKKRNQRFLDAAPAVQREILVRNIQWSGSNRFMHKLMRVESALRRWIYYPFGIRCLVTCRRDGD
jgi:SAM-dependent methyltransferase